VQVGGPQCALETSFDLNGCTIRLKDYGQPRYGLHAARCTDPQCTATVLDPCYSDMSVGDPNGAHCHGRICTKFIALEGRFPDINAALSNVTYLSDPDFNTFYGYSESLHIEVSDNGIMGDAPVTALSHSMRIPITVLPVNDAPVVGRLHAALCTDLFDDGTYDLASTKVPDPCQQLHTHSLISTPPYTRPHETGHRATLRGQSISRFPRCKRGHGHHRFA